MILKTFKKIIISILIFLIKIYQWFISPLLKTNCRYLPTCSEYSMESLKKHGIIKGIYLSVKRISNCHPFGGEGFDPVPKNTKKEI